MQTRAATSAIWTRPHHCDTERGMAETHGKRNRKQTADSRDERLKAALKANLAKRKSQPSARAGLKERRERVRVDKDMQGQEPK